MTIDPFAAGAAIGHASTSACRRARIIGPINSAIRIMMMARTTSSSTSVKARLGRGRIIGHRLLNCPRERDVQVSKVIFCCREVNLEWGVIEQKLELDQG